MLARAMSCSVLHSFRHLQTLYIIRKSQMPALKSPTSPSPRKQTCRVLRGFMRTRISAYVLGFTVQGFPKGCMGFRIKGLNLTGAASGFTGDLIFMRAIAGCLVLHDGS